MAFPPTAPTARRWTAPVTALLQLAAYVPYQLSALVAPPAGVLVMRALWLLLTVTAVFVHRRNRMLSLAVPGVTVLAGGGAVVLGGAFLGWQG